MSKICDYDYAEQERKRLTILGERVCADPSTRESLMELVFDTETAMTEPYENHAWQIFHQKIARIIERSKS